MKKQPVVGEADKLRALTEDPELRTLMEKHYADGESEASLRAFIEKADAAFPDWQATIDRSRRDGDMLRATVIHCVKAVRKRGTSPRQTGSSRQRTRPISRHSSVRRAGTAFSAKKRRSSLRNLQGTLRS